MVGAAEVPEPRAAYSQRAETAETAITEEEAVVVAMRFPPALEERAVLVVGEVLPVPPTEYSETEAREVPEDTAAVGREQTQKAMDMPGPEDNSPVKAIHGTEAAAPRSAVRSLAITVECKSKTVPSTRITSFEEILGEAPPTTARTKAARSLRLTAI